MDLEKVKLEPTRILNWLLIGLNINDFFNYAIECISNSAGFCLKKSYI